MDQDRSAYKAALAAYPTGVCVVTAQHGAAARGMTVNSFVSMSMQPRLVSWCIDLSARAYAVFAAASHYTVHVLSADDQALADRFSDGDNQDMPVDTAHPAPVLKAGVARLHCVVRERITIGDHLMLVGEVERFEHQPQHSLCYYHSHYQPLD